MQITAKNAGTTSDGNAGRIIGKKWLAHNNVGWSDHKNIGHHLKTTLLYENKHIVHKSAGGRGDELRGATFPLSCI